MYGKARGLADVNSMHEELTNQILLRDFNCSVAVIQNLKISTVVLGTAGTGFLCGFYKSLEL